MAKNTIDDLRDHLFATLESLRDEEKPMDLDRAKTVCTVAQTLIDSAKVEVKYLDVVGSESDKLKFFNKPAQPQLPASPVLIAKPNGHAKVS